MVRTSTSRRISCWILNSRYRSSTVLGPAEVTHARTFEKLHRLVFGIRKIQQNEGEYEFVRYTIDSRNNSLRLFFLYFFISIFI